MFVSCGLHFFLSLCLLFVSCLEGPFPFARCYHVILGFPRLCPHVFVACHLLFFLLVLLFCLVLTFIAHHEVNSLLLKRHLPVFGSLACLHLLVLVILSTIHIIVCISFSFGAGTLQHSSRSKDPLSLLLLGLILVGLLDPPCS